jgi:hypothetical protein
LVALQGAFTFSSEDGCSRVSTSFEGKYVTRFLCCCCLLGPLILFLYFFPPRTYELSFRYPYLELAVGREFRQYIFFLPSEQNKTRCVTCTLPSYISHGISSPLSPLLTMAAVMVWAPASVAGVPIPAALRGAAHATSYRSALRTFVSFCQGTSTVRVLLIFSVSVSGSVLFCSVCVVWWEVVDPRLLTSVAAGFMDTPRHSSLSLLCFFFPLRLSSD